MVAERLLDGIALSAWCPLALAPSAFAVTATAAIKEIVGAGLAGRGGGGIPKTVTMSLVVDNIVKWTDTLSKDRFQGWRFRLGMAAKGSSLVLAKVTNWAEEKDVAIDPTTDISTEDHAVNYKLYYVLVPLCEGEAFDVVKNVSDQNGA
jgi:hypothetical protein